MKRTFKNLLATASLAITALCAVFLPSQAQAALTVSAVQVGVAGHEITCYARWGDGTNWPSDATSAATAHYVYCGEGISSLPSNPSQATLQNLGTTALNSAVSMQQSVKDLMRTNNAVIQVFRTQQQRYDAFNTPVPPSDVNFTSSSRYTALPPILFIYEKGPGMVPVTYEVSFNTKHEIGHVYQYFKTPGTLANTAAYLALVERDFAYMNIRTPGNSYASTYSYWLTNYQSPDTRRGYEELFAEEFALSLYTAGGSLSSPKPVDPIIRDNFQCSQSYADAQRSRGQTPVSTDFDRFNTSNDPNVNFRCNIYRAPVITSPFCTLYMKTPLEPYPYHPGTGQYVDCGATPATYRTVAGDVLKNLPNNSGSSFLRDKFEQNNISLYVFISAADAQAKLGAGNIPNAALQPGVLGWSQTSPQPIGGQTPNKFIAVWENWTPWGSAVGTLVAVETTLAADGTPNRFRSGVMQQVGRMTDYLSGSLNGTTALSQRAIFASAFSTDKNAFNAKATCTVFGSPVCSGGVIQSPYTGMSNYAILTTLYPDIAGTASINTNQYLFAEQVPITAFSSGGTANGGTRKPMDDKLLIFQKCTFLYTSTQYKFWRLPTAAELSTAGCP